jgi:hypothetical protein
VFVVEGVGAEQLLDIGMLQMGKQGKIVIFLTMALCGSFLDFLVELFPNELGILHTGQLRLKSGKLQTNLAVS